jgi:putative membrane protein
MGSPHPLPASQRIILVLVAVAAGLSLIDSPYPDLAPLQNIPTLFVAGGLALALRRWPLPTSAVACLAAFLLLHTLGGRYAYSYVPYDEWVRALGLPPLSRLLGLHRNDYDRLVHLFFGLLFIHPVSALLSRHCAIRPGLSIAIAVMFVLAGSALYEIFEWLLTLWLAGPAADQYNGQQGDIWDAQKDMACAAAGAILSGLWLLVRTQVNSRAGREV